MRLKRKRNKVCHLNHFEVYSSVALSIFTSPCNGISRPFSSYKTKTLSPLNDNSPFPTPQAPAPSILLSISTNLITVGTSCKWNHIVFAFLCWLMSFSIMCSRLIHVVARVRIAFHWYSAPRRLYLTLNGLQTQRSAFFPGFCMCASSVKYH